MTISDNKKIVETFVANVFAGGDRNAAIEVLSDDCTWWMLGDLPMPRSFEGKQNVIEGVLEAADGQIELGTFFANVKTLIAEGNVVAAEWTGGFKTVNGKDYQNNYSVVFELEGGKIKAVREYNDTHYLMTFLTGG